MRHLFCWLYTQWLSKVVHEKTDPLVVFLDAVLGSSCKYCMATRAVFAGFGLGLMCLFDTWVWVGAGFVLASWGMTLGERYWLCEIKPEK